MFHRWGIGQAIAGATWTRADGHTDSVGTQGRKGMFVGLVIAEIDQPNRGGTTAFHITADPDDRVSLRP